MAQKPAKGVQPGAKGALGLERHEPVIRGFVALTTYMGYAVLIMMGHLRDFFGKLTGMSRYFHNNSRPPMVRYLVDARMALVGLECAATLARCCVVTS
jgi:hypothetical protein